MGFQTKSNFTTDVESASGFAWIQAFGDTVKARLASSALAQWWGDWAFDPHLNFVDFMQAVPLLPIFETPGFPQVQRSTDVQTSGSASLRLMPSSIDPALGVRVVSPAFRTMEGRTYEVQVRFRQDTAIGGSISLSYDAAGADKVFGSSGTMGNPVGSAPGVWTTYTRFTETLGARWSKIAIYYWGSLNPVYIDEIRVNETPARISGTSFPVGQVVNQTVLRTDRMVEYFWDGSRWLSVNEYTYTTSPYQATPSVSYTATTSFRDINPAPDAGAGTEIWVESIAWCWNVGGTNSAGNSWTLGMSSRAGTNFTSFSTANLGSLAWVRTILAVNVARTVASDVAYDINLTKVGLPAAITFLPSLVTYRLIG